MPRTILFDQELWSMAFQLQNTAYWLGKILQHRGLGTLLSILSVVEMLNINEPDPTLNYQISQ